jgi:uncharacterized protein YecE (DUF72 family)
MGKVHLGTMGWSYKFWSGNFYPTGLNPKEFLAEYSKHFNTVEVNSTFYRTPSETMVMRWKQQASPEFVFSVKFPKSITHDKMLKNCEEDVEFFIKRMSLLQGKLGPLLLQLPPMFKLGMLPILRDFLAGLPEGYNFALEVRNRNLLEDKLYSLLSEKRVALTIVDSFSMPMIEKMTADFVYVRWEGDRKKVRGSLGRLEVDRADDIKRWARKVNTYLDEGMEVFGYFSKYFSGHPPTDVSELLKLI